MVACFVPLAASLSVRRPRLFRVAPSRWVGVAFGGAKAPKGPNPIAQAAGLGDRERVTRSQGPTGRDSRRRGDGPLGLVLCGAGLRPRPLAWAIQFGPFGAGEVVERPRHPARDSVHGPALGTGDCTPSRRRRCGRTRPFPRGTHSGRSTGRRTATFLAGQVPPAGRDFGVMKDERRACPASGPHAPSESSAAGRPARHAGPTKSPARHAGATRVSRLISALARLFDFLGHLAGLFHGRKRPAQ